MSSVVLMILLSMLYLRTVLSSCVSEVMRAVRNSQCSGSCGLVPKSVTPGCVAEEAEVTSSVVRSDDLAELGVWGVASSEVMGGGVG